jgi:hypothetical protein
VVGPDEDAHDGESVRLPEWPFWVSTAGAAPGLARCSMAVTSPCSHCPTFARSSPCLTSTSWPSTCPSDSRRTASAPVTSRPAGDSAGPGVPSSPLPCDRYWARRTMWTRAGGRSRRRARRCPGSRGTSCRPSAPWTTRSVIRRSTVSSRCTPSWRSVRWTRASATRRSPPRGLAQRMAALRTFMDVDLLDAPPMVPAVDALDACAAAWSARRLADGRGECIGDDTRDSRGRPMRICW